MAEETTNKRPGLVSVLCILSFIGSGLGVLFSLLGVIGVGALFSFLENVPGMGDALTGSGGVGFLVMNLVLNGGTLFGAIMMWKMKKMGFWIYAGSYLLQFILPMVLFSGRFSIFGLIYSVKRRFNICMHHSCY